MHFFERGIEKKHHKKLCMLKADRHTLETVSGLNLYYTYSRPRAQNFISPSRLCTRSTSCSQTTCTNVYVCYKLGVPRKSDLCDFTEFSFPNIITYTNFMILDKWNKKCIGFTMMCFSYVFNQFFRKVLMLRKCRPVSL